MTQAASAEPATAASRPETMIGAIAPMLAGLKHVAVGASSPIPGSAALLARALSGGKLRVSLLGSRQHNPFTDGGKELFDCAAQGRIDAFFLSGGQIDGAGNINLVGLGGYPQADVRFPGSFGSSYLYHLIPRVILFREEHTPRTLVDKVDFISAAGASPEGEYRVGGPYALVTGLCVFRYERDQAGFSLASTHPGTSVGDIAAATGFTYRTPADVPETMALDTATLHLLRTDVARQIAETYPAFALRTWGVTAAG